MKVHRFTRSLTDRTLGGVCGGLAEYLGVNAWWVRTLFVVLGVFTAGTGILIYLALWFVMPQQTLKDIPLSGSVGERARRAEVVILIGASVIGMGLVVLARNLGVLASENGDAFLPLVAIVFGAMLLFKQLWRTA